MAEQVWKTARVVTRDGVFVGGVRAREGRIIEVFEGACAAAGEDCGGDILAPGLVDLHTDNLEKHYYPRAHIDWPAASAAIAHDGHCLGQGVTTVLNALTIDALTPNQTRHRDAVQRLVEGFEAARRGAALKADHHVHWRCELSADDFEPTVRVLAPLAPAALFSLMDHTPGQRQYRDLEAVDAGWQAEGLSRRARQDRLAEALDRQARNAAPNRRLVATLAREAGAPLAAHDEETAEQVTDAAAAGATIAEFPVAEEAARAARAHGMTVLMGGPNLIRGGSYSGNVAAADLVARGLVDGFASDYVPRSLIECAFLLAAPPFGWGLAQAFHAVAGAPAEAARLLDRGAIAPGLRADLIRVGVGAGLPLVRGVWVAGRRAA
jgi:alpha-D-ribose 1-methylphosphonate 5-triphosphate diphosphatase